MDPARSEIGRRVAQVVVMKRLNTKFVVSLITYMIRRLTFASTRSLGGRWRPLCAALGATG